jgi:hypothetical protein
LGFRGSCESKRDAKREKHVRKHDENVMENAPAAATSNSDGSALLSMRTLEPSPYSETAQLYSPRSVSLAIIPNRVSFL